MKGRLPPARNWNEGLAEDLKDPLFASEFILGALAQGASVEEVLSKVASHVTLGSVFKDLGFDEAQSEALEVKAALLKSILDLVEKRGYKQRDLEKLLEQLQPRVSELLNGKFSTMSIEKLLDYLQRL